MSVSELPEATSAPLVTADDIVIHRIHFLQSAKPFEQRVNSCISACIGEGKNYPSDRSFNRALINMVTSTFKSQSGIDISLRRLTQLNQALSKNHAIIMAAVIGIAVEDMSSFLEAARADFEEKHREQPEEIRKHWDEVAPPIDESLLWAARPILVAEAMNEARAEAQLQDTPASRRQMHDIVEARRIFNAMQVYDEDVAKQVSVKLFQMLVDTAPGIADAPNKALALQEAVHGKIGRTTFGAWLKEGTAKQDKLATDNAVDMLVEKTVGNPQLRKECSNYLLGIPWIEPNKAGHDLMKYAVTHQLSAKNLLRLTRYQSRMNFEAYAKKLDISESDLGRLGGDRKGAPLRTLLDSVAGKLGCIDEHDKIVFRQLVLGIDPSRATQALLDRCFDDKDDSCKDEVFVDVDARGIERGQAIGRFCKLLREARGLRDVKELAEAIVEQRTDINGDLQMIIHMMAVPESEVDKPAATVSLGTRRLQMTTNEDIAQAIAEFAFPKNNSLQKQCKPFFSSARYQGGASNGTRPDDVRRKSGGYEGRA